LGGVDSLSLMMMDVVSQLPEIKVCVAYELDGERIEYFPSRTGDLRRLQPIYETFPGWQRDMSAATSLDDFPRAARHFLDRVSQLVGFPIDIISVGPGRTQTIIVKEPTG
jgi:adenylosuccinate synthase